MENMPKLLTTEEVAKILRVHPSTITKMRKKKLLIGTKSFGNLKFPEDEVMRVIQREINKERTI